MSDYRQNIEISFERTVSKAQYEPERAFVKTSFSAPDDATINVDALLRELKGSVYRILGLSAPERGTVTATVGTSKPEAENTSEKKRGPGRPPGAEKAEKIALEAKAREAADVALKTVDPMADVLDISKGDDAVKDEDDVLGLTEVVEKEARPITDQELQNEAGKAVQRLGDSKVIRAMVKNNYKVAKLDEVPQNLRAAVVSDLRNIQKDGTIKKEDK